MKTKTLWMLAVMASLAAAARAQVPAASVTGNWKEALKEASKDMDDLAAKFKATEARTQYGPVLVIVRSFVLAFPSTTVVVKSQEDKARAQGLLEAVSDAPRILRGLDTPSVKTVDEYLARKDRPQGKEKDGSASEQLREMQKRLEIIADMGGNFAVVYKYRKN